MVTIMWSHVSLAEAGAVHLGRDRKPSVPAGCLLLYRISAEKSVMRYKSACVRSQPEWTHAAIRSRTQVPGLESMMMMEEGQEGGRT